MKADAMMRGIRGAAGGDTLPPRIPPERASFLSGLEMSQLKTLRKKRLVKYYRFGHRTIVYDTRSLLDLVESGAVEALPSVRRGAAR